MHEVKLSSKNQIVIPREIRNALQVKAGDRLVVVRRGDTVILFPKPKGYARAIAGIAKEPYSTGYLKEERESWR